MIDDTMARNLLVISNDPDSVWLEIVGDALQSLGELQVVSEQEASMQIKVKDYDLMILDATAISGDIATLVARLHKERPNVPIVVATTSPTWQRARQVFRAGASDYIRKSLDRERILASLREVFER
jgi:DNA-binding NtrC family response regulator